MAHGTALLLSNEISSVVTAMRNNSKWALVPNRYGQRVHRIWMLLLQILQPDALQRPLFCRTMRLAMTLCWIISSCSDTGSSTGEVRMQPCTTCSTCLAEGYCRQAFLGIERGALCMIV